MEVTGRGDTRGLDAAQVCAPWNGPRQDWAHNASMRKGHVAEGHYMGEINTVRDMMTDNEPSVNPDIFYRDVPTSDGSWSHGWFPK